MRSPLASRAAGSSMSSSSASTATRGRSCRASCAVSKPRSPSPSRPSSLHPTAPPWRATWSCAPTQSRARSARSGSTRPWQPMHVACWPRGPRGSCATGRKGSGSATDWTSSWRAWPLRRACTSSVPSTSPRHCAAWARSSASASPCAMPARSSQRRGGSPTPTRWSSIGRIDGWPVSPWTSAPSSACSPTTLSSTFPHSKWPCGPTRATSAPWDRAGRTRTACVGSRRRG